MSSSTSQIEPNLTRHKQRQNEWNKTSCNGRITDLSDDITTPRSALISKIFYVSLKILKFFLKGNVKFKCH